jgi:cell division protein FtsL
MGFKITGTAYWEVAKGGKYETGTTKTYVAASEKAMIATITTLATSISTTSASLDQRCSTIEQTAASLNQTVTSLQQNAASLTQQLGALDTRVVGTCKLASLSMMITAQTYLKIKSGVITSIE